MSAKYVELEGKSMLRLLHPRPTVIIVARGYDGEVNGCAVAWITPVNVDPPVIAFSLSPKRYTHKLVRETGEVTINMMGLDTLEKTHYVGSVSGRDVKGKLEKAGLTLVPSRKIRPPSIAESLGVLECKVTGTIEFTDHDLFICEVVDARARSDVLEQEKGIMLERTKPLLHVGSNIYTTTNGYHRAGKQ